MKLFPEFQNHLPRQITSTLKVTAIPPLTSQGGRGLSILPPSALLPSLPTLVPRRDTMPLLLQEEAGIWVVSLA